MLIPEYNMVEKVPCHICRKTNLVTFDFHYGEGTVFVWCDDCKKYTLASINKLALEPGDVVIIYKKSVDPSCCINIDMETAGFKEYQIGVVREVTRWGTLLISNNSNHVGAFKPSDVGLIIREETGLEEFGEIWLEDDCWDDWFDLEVEPMKKWWAKAWYWVKKQLLKWGDNDEL